MIKNNNGYNGYDYDDDDDDENYGMRGGVREKERMERRSWELELFIIVNGR